jgi:3-isopropylmalate/(R)-2-methylmalate dehydratase small subunit
VEAFVKHTGLVVPLNRANVDTDQIVPKQFLKRIGRTGFGEVLFFDWRYLADGTPNPDFVLNRPEYAGASVMVAGKNFGCGSSREHAPWAIREYGIRAILAPSFADIFRNNCLRNGLVPVVVDEEAAGLIMTKAERGSGYRLTVSVEDRTVSDEEGLRVSFELDDFWRRCLMEGTDEIALALRSEREIAAYEARRPSYMPAVSERVS